MRFRLIDEEESRHPISRMARVLGVTAAGYHAWKRRAPSPRRLEDACLKERIANHFESSHDSCGAPRILADLADEGIRGPRKRVARLTRELGITGVIATAILDRLLHHIHVISIRGEGSGPKTNARLGRSQEGTRRRIMRPEPGSVRDRHRWGQSDSGVDRRRRSAA